MDAPPTSTPPTIVYVDDDDDEEFVDDEWAEGGAHGRDPALDNAGKIAMQIRLCQLLLYVLAVLAVLIALAWRRYGDVIKREYEERAAAEAAARTPQVEPAQAEKKKTR